MNKIVMALDFGASSGRACLFWLENGKLTFKEIHRFENSPVKISGRYCWDAMRLFHEIKTALKKSKDYGELCGIGIDTWGVDFALIDKHGELLQNPVHYRDTRTDGMIEKIREKISDEELFALSGLQFMSFNTLYQLSYLVENRSELIALTDKFLMMPDFFAYLLTGEKRAELTEASTTMLLDQKTLDWNFNLIERLKIPKSIFPKIIKTGEKYGVLTQELANELDLPQIPIFAAPSHDTASAIASMPAENPNFAFLSCGTWSLFGAECDDALLTPEVFAHSFTNERGYGKKVTLLKNITGLWIFQECCRDWQSQGLSINFDEIAAAALEAKPFASFIDVDAKDFELPTKMPQKIADYCKRTGQYAPKTVGEIARCFYESIALKYKQSMQELQELCGNREVLHIVGGGSKSSILCQFTANACGIKVVAGPSEGTATGNAIAVLSAIGEVGGLNESRALVKKSFSVVDYLPKDQSIWNTAFEKYKAVTKE